jgi:hypothetical protein
MKDANTKTDRSKVVLDLMDCVFMNLHQSLQLFPACLTTGFSLAQKLFLVELVYFDG